LIFIPAAAANLPEDRFCFSTGSLFNNAADSELGSESSDSQTAAAQW
jgi:hypothetical protein